MGQADSRLLSQSALLHAYQIETKPSEPALAYLTHKQTGKPFLLRESTFSNQKDAILLFQRLQTRKQLRSQYLTRLSTVEQHIDDGLCSRFFRIFALWEYPQHTLAQQINCRALERRPFTPEELEKLVSELSLGLLHLQLHQVNHESLTTKTLLLDNENKTLKVADPLCIQLPTNLSYVLGKRGVKNIYLSPEQCEAIDRQITTRSGHDSQKEDVFTAGMIVLEAGLLERQNECYLDECSAVNWHILQRNLNRFQANYGRELRLILDLMLTKELATRLNWQQINQRLRNYQMERRSLSKVKPKEIDIHSRFSLPVKITPLDVQSKESTQPINLQTSNYPSINHQLIHNHTLLPTPKGSNYQKKISFDQNTTTNYSSPLNYSLTTAPNHPPFSQIRTVHPSLQHYTLQTATSEPFQRQLLTLRPMVPALPFPKQQNRCSPRLGNSKVNNSRLMEGHFEQVRQVESISFDTVQSRKPSLSLEKQELSTSRHQHSQNPTPNISVHHVQKEHRAIYVLEQFRHGSRYEGYKLEGLREGWGKFYFQDGGCYQGEWKGNKMHGFGKLYYQSGKLAYEGYWQDDQFNGFGKLYNENPDALTTPFDYHDLDAIDDYWVKYEGLFRNDLKEGEGKITLSNGQVFEGNFHLDLAEGEGRYWERGGGEVRGWWRENRAAGGQGKP